MGCGLSTMSATTLWGANHARWHREREYVVQVDLSRSMGTSLIAYVAILMMSRWAPSVD